MTITTTKRNDNNNNNNSVGPKTGPTAGEAKECVWGPAGGRREECGGKDKRGRKRMVMRREAEVLQEGMGKEIYFCVYHLFVCLFIFFGTGWGEYYTRHGEMSIN